MTGTVLGLHHVTAIAGDAQANHDFYVRTLGQRMVKRTVNFDDPSAWHLYYGDRTGSAEAGIMTFFAWASMIPGAVGAGQASVTQYAAPRGALGFWRDRLTAAGAPILDRAAPFGETALYARDPDGLVLALVEVADDPRDPWLAGGIDATVALRGLRGVELLLRDGRGVGAVLREAFGYAEAGVDGQVTRFALAGSASGVVDVRGDRQAPAGRGGSGTVHHVAFAVRNRAEQLAMRKRMQALGLQVTEQIDRDYFWAIYARTPGGVLFEVATEEPGFAVDEPVETLGTELRLPRMHEPHRAAIQRILPPLRA
ncbi:MAG: ring-cleaving dioxygenase [Rubrimonas sp.]